MKNASGTPVGTITFDPLGMGAGGWTTGIDIHPDGSMVTRNDTTPGHIWMPATSTKIGYWRSLFEPGVTYPNADAVYRNTARRSYEVWFGDASNSNVLLSATGGYIWKSTDKGFNWTKLTGYNAGALDTTLSTSGNENARISGQHGRSSPSNANSIGICGTTFGLRYSLDGGTTWATSASVPAPTNNIGGCIHFVSDTEVWVVSNGNVAMRSTTGVGGTFTAVSGGPTICGSIASGGGNVYFISDGQGTDTQLFKYSAGAFTQPAGVSGAAVAVRPNLTSKVVIVLAGGGMRTSLDTGATWNFTGHLYGRICNDIPYHGRSSADYLALGSIAYHPTTDRLFVTHGLGVYHMDSPPGTVASKWTSMSLGIEQMLGIQATTSPNGTTCVSVHDKVAFMFTRANATQQAEKQVPNNDVAINHATMADYFIDDEAKWACVYMYDAVASLTVDAGKTWTDMPTIPTRVDGSGVTQPFIAGQIACGNTGNMVWASMFTSGGGAVATNQIKYTTDGGVTWLNPTFGASVSMVGAMWHSTYVHYREILKAYKGSPGTFYVFCNGIDASNSAADLASLGVWKSTNGGANWTKIRAGRFISQPVDYYHSKLVLNNNASGHAFWVAGGINNYPTAPTTDGIFFTNDDWATTYSATGALAGWSAPDTMAIGAKFSAAQVYETLYVIGYRGGIYGTWMCIDFNPATRAGTWTLIKQWLIGKVDDEKNVITADPTIPGRIIVCPGSGGGGVGRYVDLATGT